MLIPVKKRVKREVKKVANLSERGKQIISLELERSKLNREKSLLILNKALFLYFLFLFIGVIGFVNNYISAMYLNVLIVLALVALVMGTLPYISIMRKEEIRLNKLILDLKKGGRK